VTITVVEPSVGEIIAAGPLRIRILEDGSHTHHRLGLVEVTIPPHIDGPPQHIHRNHDETFYVISGTASFVSGVDTITAGAGTLLAAAPGVPHTFGNPSDVPAVLLCTVTPDLYIDYFRELGKLRRGPEGGLDPHDIADLMARYATEIHN